MSLLRLLTGSRVFQRQLHHLYVCDNSWKPCSYSSLFLHNQHAFCSTQGFFFFFLLCNLGEGSGNLVSFGLASLISFLSLWSLLPPPGGHVSIWKKWPHHTRSAPLFLLDAGKVLSHKRSLWVTGYWFPCHSCLCPREYSTPHGESPTPHSTFAIFSSVICILEGWWDGVVLKKKRQTWNWV